MRKNSDTQQSKLQQYINLCLSKYFDVYSKLFELFEIIKKQMIHQVNKRHNIYNIGLRGVP